MLRIGNEARKAGERGGEPGGAFLQRKLCQLRTGLLGDFLPAPPKEVDHALDAEGTTRVEPDGSITVRGTTVVDPRDLGVPIPRFIPLRCRSAWDLRVLPAD